MTDSTDKPSQNLAYSAPIASTREERLFEQRAVDVPAGEIVTLNFHNLYDTYIIRNAGLNGYPLSISIGSGPHEGNVAHVIRPGEWVRLPAIDHRLHLFAYLGAETATVIAESGWSQIGFSSPRSS